MAKRVICRLFAVASVLDAAIGEDELVGAVIDVANMACGAKTKKKKNRKKRDENKQCNRGGGSLFSFPEGAEIWTESGIIEVQDIQVGDRVWSYNEETGARELALVADTFDRITRNMVSLEYETSSGETINLRVTPEHPFLTASGAFSGRGDEGGWVEAGSLKAGDTIFDMDGGLPSRVKSVRFENISEKVYNFEVEGHHNYFVSEDGLLVHNGRGAAWSAIFEDPKTGSRIRGWIQQELNRGRTFSRVRTPPGCDLGHPLGRPAKDGNPHGPDSRIETPRDNRRRGAKYGL